MTNMEIEDVLSSIRRLVSEDLRPAPRDSAVPEPEGKLVLTPAFRISEPASVKLEEPPVWRRAASRYRTESAEIEDMEPDTGDSDLDGLSEDLEQDAPLRLVADETAIESDDAEDLEFPEDSQDEGAVPLETALMEQQVAHDHDTASTLDASSDLPGHESAADAATLEAAIAELEAAVAASDEDWEPDGSEMTSGDHFVLPPMGAGRVMAEAAEAFGLHPGTEQGLRRLHLEPGPYQEDPSEPVWSDAVPEQPRRSGLAETDPGDPSMFAGDEALLDEGMLRELVIEVIRQELQGALGERITRNVRKLVRAEIHRALAGREFE